MRWLVAEFAFETRAHLAHSLDVLRQTRDGRGNVPNVPIALHHVARSKVIHDQCIALRASGRAFPGKRKGGSAAVASVVLGQIAAVHDLGTGEDKRRQWLLHRVWTECRWCFLRLAAAAAGRTPGLLLAAALRFATATFARARPTLTAAATSFTGLVGFFGFGSVSGNELELPGATAHIGEVNRTLLAADHVFETAHLAFSRGGEIRDLGSTQRWLILTHRIGSGLRIDLPFSFHHLTMERTL